MKTPDTQHILIDLQYLPSLEFFTCVLNFDEIVLESNEYFAKQSYRNRCYLKGSNKVEMLTIPVIDGNKKILMKDVEIDYSQRWETIHWRTMNAAYGKSPFFEYFADYFQAVYDKKPKFLWDLNYSFLTICLKLLKVDKTIRQTDFYQKEVNEGVFDARSLINAKKDYKSNDFYQAVAYQQNFGNDFVPNLSIIDLLFCRGNQSLEILKKSSTI
ncbi:WbqC family protein [Emticicia sp. SJ17W-69]|uniref:WbqC family protein n=1 Tax=Emticicia sp. SJ17W-69 TaxID=3421657 RepID=UPI003EB93F3A